MGCLPIRRRVVQADAAPAEPESYTPWDEFEAMYDEIDTEQNQRSLALEKIGTIDFVSVIGEWLYNHDGLILPSGLVHWDRMSTLRRCKVAGDITTTSCTITQTGVAAEAIVDGDNLRFWDSSAAAELGDRDDVSLSGTSLSWSGALAGLAVGDQIWAYDSIEMSLGDEANDRRIILLGGELAINNAVTPNGIQVIGPEVAAGVWIRCFDILTSDDPGDMYSFYHDGIAFETTSKQSAQFYGAGLTEDGSRMHTTGMEYDGGEATYYPTIGVNTWDGGSKVNATVPVGADADKITGLVGLSYGNGASPDIRNMISTATGHRDDDATYGIKQSVVSRTTNDMVAVAGFLLVVQPGYGETMKLSVKKSLFHYQTELNT